MASQYAQARLESGIWVPYGQIATVEPPPLAFDPTRVLMGVSNSPAPSEQGGTQLWDCWRVYGQDDLFNISNRTNTATTRRPLAMVFSDDGGQPLGGLTPTYAAVKAYAITVLDDYYYNGTGQTHSARWGIKLYWLNGNENSDKGPLSLPHTSAGIAYYLESQRGLYDACHALDGVTGLRRYPDAFAGTNPTQNQEQNNQVADWLHGCAHNCDVVAWSMYPPGRQTTTDNPTYNWGSESELDWNNLRLGFMLRCFRRTSLAQTAAQANRPGHKLLIGGGEVGIGDDPANKNSRPFYLVFGIMEHGMRLSTKYQLEYAFMCYWDNQTRLQGGGIDPTKPQNILTDEVSTTSPSSRDAWQNHLAYNPYRVHPVTGTRGVLPQTWLSPVVMPYAAMKHSGTPLTPATFVP